MIKDDKIQAIFSPHFDPSLHITPTVMTLHGQHTLSLNKHTKSEYLCSSGPNAGANRPKTQPPHSASGLPLGVS